MGLFPKAPDPKETAAAQTGTNVATAVANARLNNVNQVTPDGKLQYKTVGTQKFTDPTTGETFNIPKYKMIQTLSDHGKELKGINDQTQVSLATMARDQSSRLQDHLGKPVDLSTMPAAGDASSITGGEATRSRVEEALMSRMNPQLDRDRDRLRTELSNSGIKLGSEAYDRGMSDFGQQSNDARMAAILGAGQEASRVTDIDLAKFNAANSSRSQALNEAYSSRNQPINEVSALMSGGAVQQPQFGTTPVNKIPTVDYAGLVNQNYQQKSARGNQILGGLFSLGSAGVGAF